jgi:16S rRNA (uracil1498-N3)-methyltransferase
MNLILLEPADFVEGRSRVRLTGRRKTHVREIQRAEVGDTLCVGLVDGEIGDGRVVSRDDDALELEVSLERPPPAPLPITLVLALPRPLVLKRALISATSMGIKRIVLVNARRVEKSFWQSTALAEDALREQLVLGLEQARDTRMPEIWLRPRFRPFVEDELPALVGGGRGLVADPRGAIECPRALEGPLTLAIGPEGGWSEHELDRFSAAGFRAVSLGERILRVETALPALVFRLC